MYSPWDEQIKKSKRPFELNSILSQDVPVTILMKAPNDAIDDCKLYVKNLLRIWKMLVKFIAKDDVPNINALPNLFKLLAIYVTLNSPKPTSIPREKLINYAIQLITRPESPLDEYSIKIPRVPSRDSPLRPQEVPVNWSPGQDISGEFPLPDGQDYDQITPGEYPRPTEQDIPGSRPNSDHPGRNWPNEYPIPIGRDPPGSMPTGFYPGHDNNWPDKYPIPVKQDTTGFKPIDFYPQRDNNRPGNYPRPTGQDIPGSIPTGFYPGRDKHWPDNNPRPIGQDIPTGFYPESDKHWPYNYPRPIGQIRPGSTPTGFIPGHESNWPVNYPRPIGQNISEPIPTGFYPGRDSNWPDKYPRPIGQDTPWPIPAEFHPGQSNILPDEYPTPIGYDTSKFMPTDYHPGYDNTSPGQYPRPTGHSTPWSIPTVFYPEQHNTRPNKYFRPEGQDIATIKPIDFYPGGDKRTKYPYSIEQDTLKPTKDTIMYPTTIKHNSSWVITTGSLKPEAHNLVTHTHSTPNPHIISSIPTDQPNIIIDKDTLVPVTEYPTTVKQDGSWPGSNYPVKQDTVTIYGPKTPQGRIEISVPEPENECQELALEVLVETFKKLYREYVKHVTDCDESDDQLKRIN